jgi:uncharacterized protein
MTFDINQIPIVDTHEHLFGESYRMQERDVLALFLYHYFTTDLKISGLSDAHIDVLRDPGTPLMQRWALAEPFWRAAANTAYARVLKIAAHDLYGIDAINRETIGELASKVAQASTPGFYQQIFQKAGIDWAVVDELSHLYHPNQTYNALLQLPSDPPGLFQKTITLSSLVFLRDRGQLAFVEQQLSAPPVHSLQDWLDLIEAVFQRNPQAVALKLAHAYMTSLEVSKPSREEANVLFNRLLGASSDQFWRVTENNPTLDHYLLHFAIQQATRHGLPIQIHTGLLEGTFNDLRNANPLHLIPLLREYPEARFVLFHGGYPWIREFIALGKMYPNVWLDLCWVWAISPQAGRTLLHELIEVVPSNKVTAFGGDYIFIEGTYGHSVLARQNITQVLQERIASGWFSEAEALQYAQAILSENARQLYRPVETA